MASGPLSSYSSYNPYANPYSDPTRDIYEMRMEIKEMKSMLDLMSNMVNEIYLAFKSIDPNK